jgi:5-bromo-4-chloroindolyl phosphate hydrolysis protein
MARLVGGGAFALQGQGGGLSGIGPLLGSRNAPVRSALQEALPALARLDETAPQIEAFSVRLEADSIIATGRRVVDDVRRAPEKLPAVQRLLIYYLPRAADLLGAYRVLEAAGAEPERRADIEALIPRLGEAFRRYAERLDEDDLRLLDLEIRLVDESLKEDLR